MGALLEADELAFVAELRALLLSASVEPVVEDVAHPAECRELGRELAAVGVVHLGSFDLVVAENLARDRLVDDLFEVGELDPRTWFVPGCLLSLHEQHTESAHCRELGSRRSADSTSHDEQVDAADRLLGRI